ncbi:MAG: hypothetical protein FWG52_00035, partial [Proteobacteria bacterium]|nr:hypothetical protein [Pseudomonadota bacterium]
MVCKAEITDEHRLDYSAISLENNICSIIYGLRAVKAFARTGKTSQSLIYFAFIHHSDPLFSGLNGQADHVIRHFLAFRQGFSDLPV